MKLACAPLTFKPDSALLRLLPSCRSSGCACFRFLSPLLDFFLSILVAQESCLLVGSVARVESLNVAGKMCHQRATTPYFGVGDKKPPLISATAPYWTGALLRLYNFPHSQRKKTKSSHIFRRNLYHIKLYKTLTFFSLLSQIISIVAEF